MSKGRLPGVTVALVLFWGAGCDKAPPPPPPAAVKVQVAEVAARDVPITQQWVGSLDGYPNAQIRAQVSGYLLRQAYQEGATVKQGDLLFEIDPRPFQSILDAALARQHQNEALVAKTSLDVKRFTPLAKTQAVSQQTLDDAVQANLMAQAAVEADKAAVENARLNLSFCRITAPVDGVTGLALAQVGDLVGPGTGVLTTVSTVNPIRAYFSISEQFYLSFFHGAGATPADRPKLEDVPVQLVLTDGSVYPAPGKWAVTGRQVDISTGTLQAAATFDNPGNFLRPGQYALIRAQTELRKGVVLVPQRALTELQGAFQVAVVNATNGVHLQTVKVGEQIGSDWIVTSGLQPGERIVVEGVQKVREGAKVEVLTPVPAAGDKRG